MALFDRSANDTFSVVDQLTANVEYGRDSTDAVAVADQLTTDTQYVREESDTIAVTDEILHLDFDVSDAVAVTDAVIAALNLADLAAQDQISVADTIEIFFQETERVSVSLSLYILGFETADMDVAIKGTTEITAGMDLDIFGVPEVSAGLDLLIQGLTQFRFMRIRKDLTTRYFGGNPSDANFFESFDPPNVGAVVTNSIGVFNDSHRKLIFSALNTIPSGGNFDKYSLPLTAPITLDTIGLRVLVNFQLTEFGDNSNVMFGLFNDQLDPASSIASGDICAFAFETEKDHIEFRAWYGTSSSFLDLGTAVLVDRFIGKNLLVEIELVNTGAVKTMEFRLFEADVSLSVPIFSTQIETATDPAVDRFSITSLGKRTPELPSSNMGVAFEYVDIELATGTTYAVPATGLPVLEAKFRLLQDRPPIELLGEGTNQVFVALSPDGITINTEAEDTIFIDTSDPKISVLSFTSDSDVIVPGSVSPPILKVSPNSGFDEVFLTWMASHVGTYTLRLNSTSPNDGTEILSGDYPTVGDPVSISWSFADIPQVDDTHDITLYLVADTGKHTAKKLGIFLLPFSPKVSAKLDVFITV